jgi:anti-anti-sigma factor
MQTDALVDRSLIRKARWQEPLEKVVMVFGGEYDIACKEHLRDDLAPLTNAPDVILDFTDVTYIDSSFLNELVALHKNRDAKGYKSETIVVNNENLIKLFGLLGLQGVFAFVGGLEEVVVKNDERIGLYYTSCGGGTCLHTKRGAVV